jgi:hypothetical protein
VRRGLVELQRTRAADLAACLTSDAPWFRFTSAADTRRSYRNYVLLGNELMRSVDGATFHKQLSYGIDAKIFEWCVIFFFDPTVGAL